MDRDELDRLAGEVLATLDGAAPPLLRAFASGLQFADGPVGLFATPIGYLADNVEHGEPADELTRLSMRAALRRAALEGSLADRLAEATSPFWQAVGDAVAAVATDLQTA